MSEEQEVSTQPEFPGDAFNSQLPEAPASPAPEPVQSGPDEHVLERAESLGMSEKDFEGMSSDQVAAAIDRAEAIAFNRFRQLQQQSTSWSQQPQDTPPWVQQAPQQQWQPPQQQQQPQQMQAWQNPQQQMQAWNSPPGQQQPLPQFKVDLDPNEYDEGIIKTMTAMNEFWQNQYQQLQGSMQAAVQTLQSFEDQQNAEFSAWFDRSITKLGDDVGSVYGKGPIGKLSESSQEAQARIEAYKNYLDYLAFQGLPANHRDDELLSRVVRMTRGAPSDQQKQLSEKLKQRSKGTIGRPSQKRASASEASERDPFTGLSTSTVNDVQSMIDGMIGS